MTDEANDKKFEEVYETLPSHGWLSKEEAKLLHSYLAPSMICLEVGCYHGRSTTLLASFTQEVHCLDPFAGFSSEDPDGSKTLQAFVDNLRERGLRDKVTLHKCRLESWAWDSKKRDDFDLAYLDGDHTVEGTKRQILMAVVLGCDWIFVHDVNDTGEGAAIKEVALRMLGPWTERVGRLAVWVR